MLLGRFFNDIGNFVPDIIKALRGMHILYFFMQNEGRQADGFIAMVAGEGGYEFEQ